MTDLRRAVLGRTCGDPTEAVYCYECPACEASFSDWPGDCPGCGRVVVRVLDHHPVSGFRRTNSRTIPSA